MLVKLLNAHGLEMVKTTFSNPEIARRNAECMARYTPTVYITGENGITAIYRHGKPIDLPACSRQ